MLLLETVALPGLFAPPSSLPRSKRRALRRVPGAASGPAAIPQGVKPMTTAHAKAAARLHRGRIPTGFLSKLGSLFLRQLYAAIPSSPSGFGFVWQDPSGEVLGFITCAESTGRLYKQSLKRRGLLMALPLVKFVLRPSFIKRMLETLRYPSEVSQELPQAEVLSIAVARHAAGKGVGKALMSAALEGLTRRGIDNVKVACAAANDVANAFYRRCGFELVQTQEHHGLPMNLYVAKDLKSRPTPVEQAPADRRPRLSRALFAAKKPAARLPVREVA